MAAIRWIIGLIITICIAIFAIINRIDVPLAWSPIHETINIPLYVIILSSMAIGFIFGGALVWINSSSTRKDKRKQKKEIKLLEKEINRLKDDKFAPSTPATDIISTLPIK